VTGCTFSGNQTGSGGTGLYAFNGSKGVGGAVYAKAGKLAMVNSTVSGNDGRAVAGVGIDDAATAKLVNSTFAGNTGGSSLASGQPAVVGNDIIDDAGGQFSSLGHNLVGYEESDGTDRFFFTHPTDKKGTGEAPLDLKLGPLADNGGPTLTRAPLAGSLALDGGDNSLAKDAGGAALTTDQRGAGFVRVADSADAGATQTVDVGAFEANPSIQNIPDKATTEDTPISFSFGVGDEAAGLSSVTAESSNASLAPNDADHISVSGSGATRTLSITPAPGANTPANGSATIVVTATGAGGQTATDSFVLTVAAVNDPPSGVDLSNTVVADNSPAGAAVGALSTSDPDAGDAFTYTLAAGAGDSDNVSFTVEGSTLKTNAVFDFETKRSYFVRVRSTDSGGAFAERAFVITVADGPDNPGAVAFSSDGFTAGEAGGVASITLTRAGGADNEVSARVSLADVTTSRADYVFAPGSLDTSFNPGSGADNHVRGLALQPDGKAVIVGDFTLYNGAPRTGVARVNADGSLDASFDPGTGTASTFRSVEAVALQPDGKIIIGGTFGAYNGAARHGLARVNPDGSLDASFVVGSGVDDAVQAVALQPDGKIIIGGRFFFYNGTPIENLARLNPDGSLDATFNVGPGLASGLGFGIQAIALQPDGKVIIGGDFTGYNGASRNRVARLNADGSLDSSFDPGSGAAIDGTHDRGVQAMALRPDGRLLIAGGFVSYNGTPVRGVARLNADGSLDAGFTARFRDRPNVGSLALQPDGKVIAGVVSTDSEPPTTLARLNADGSLDSSFVVGSGPFFGVDAIASLPDGRLLIGGGSRTIRARPVTGSRA
jgi:uncharacterized delta-60 repeat protein